MIKKTSIGEGVVKIVGQQETTSGDDSSPTWDSHKEDLEEESGDSKGV